MRSAPPPRAPPADLVVALTLPLPLPLPSSPLQVWHSYLACAEGAERRRVLLEARSTAAAATASAPLPDSGGDAAAGDGGGGGGASLRRTSRHPMAQRARKSARRPRRRPTGPSTARGAAAPPSTARVGASWLRVDAESRRRLGISSWNDALCVRPCACTGWSARALTPPLALLSHFFAGALRPRLAHSLPAAMTNEDFFLRWDAFRTALLDVAARLCASRLHAVPPELRKRRADAEIRACFQAAVGVLEEDTPCAAVFPHHDAVPADGLSSAVACLCRRSHHDPFYHRTSRMVVRAPTQPCPVRCCGPLTPRPVHARSLPGPAGERVDALPPRPPRHVRLLERPAADGARRGVCHPILCAA